MAELAAVLQTGKLRPLTGRSQGKPKETWLITDRSTDGSVRFIVRLEFGPLQGPSYFGGFQTRQEAQEFYDRAEEEIRDCLLDAITDLRNVAFEMTHS